MCNGLGGIFLCFYKVFIFCLYFEYKVNRLEVSIETSSIYSNLVKGHSIPHSEVIYYGICNR